jgi:hypothetical protein
MIWEETRINVSSHRSRDLGASLLKILTNFSAIPSPPLPTSSNQLSEMKKKEKYA